MPLPVVPYHRQEGEDHCGAACLKMVIEALGRKSGSQASLFADAHRHGRLDPATGWLSPPDGVEWTLETRTELRNSALEVAALTTELALTRRLVWSLFHHSVPPIALVYGLEHWVVVVGYDIDRDPNGPSDSGYNIRALEIHDPWRKTEEGDPPPPPPPRHITMREWQRTYLKPVPSGYWKAKVVAVGVFGTGA